MPTIHPTQEKEAILISRWVMDSHQNVVAQLLGISLVVTQENVMVEGNALAGVMMQEFEENRENSTYTENGAD